MLTLRPATPSDLPILLLWDEQPHVLESDPNDDWEWGKELQRSPVWREQLMAEWEGRPIGFVQIIDPELEESQYWGEMGPGYRAIDIWIGAEEDLGKGYGMLMMQLALDRCFANPEVHSVLIDPLASNVRAHKFYERLGFQFLREQRFGLDECKVYVLTREI